MSRSERRGETRPRCFREAHDIHLRAPDTPWNAIIDADRDCADFIDWDIGASLEQHVAFKRDERLRGQMQPAPPAQEPMSAPLLEDEQLDLLRDLVRRGARAPREHRKFAFYNSLSGPFFTLQTELADRVPVAEGDLAVLRRAGLIEFISETMFVLTPEGMHFGAGVPPTARGNAVAIGWEPETLERATREGMSLIRELADIEAQDPPTLVIVVLVRPAVEQAAELVGVSPAAAPEGAHEDIIGAKANVSAGVRMLEGLEKVAERGANADGLLSLAQRGSAFVRLVGQAWDRLPL